MSEKTTEKSRSLSINLLWMGAIWFGSVMTLGVVATGFRALMQAAGMSSH